MCRGVTAWRAQDGPQPEIDLDHIGFATPDVLPDLKQLVGHLGATLLYGGITSGCRFVVNRMGDAHVGMDLELLEPSDDDNPFLVRFLERNGAGPHHLCFLVRDLAVAVERVRASGVIPVLERTDDPTWQEAFLSPRDTGGMVVQLGQTPGLRSDRAYALARADEHLGERTTPRRGSRGPAEVWWQWPGERAQQMATLLKVGFFSADLERTRALYVGALGGEVVDESDVHLELRWPRGGTLRFVLAPAEPEGFECLGVHGVPEGMTAFAGARLIEDARTAPVETEVA